MDDFEASAPVVGRRFMAADRCAVDGGAAASAPAWIHTTISLILSTSVMLLAMG